MSLPSREVLTQHIAKAIELGKGTKHLNKVVRINNCSTRYRLKEPASKIREVVNLPKGRGKEAKVCVVVDPDLAEVD